MKETDVEQLERYQSIIEVSNHHFQFIIFHIASGNII